MLVNQQTESHQNAEVLFGPGIDTVFDAWLTKGSLGFADNGRYFLLTGKDAFSFSEAEIRNGFMVSLKQSEIPQQLVPAKVIIKNGLHVSCLPDPDLSNGRKVNHGVTPKNEQVYVIHNMVSVAGTADNETNMDLVIPAVCTTASKATSRLIPRLFISYCHTDESYCNKLQIAFQSLVQQGKLEVWCDRRLTAGSKLDQEIECKLRSSHIVLLLVSPDFIASPYCRDVEVKIALELHKRNAAIIVPVILRPCNWHDTPFASFLALPKDGLPISKWADHDDAIQNVIDGVKNVINSHHKQTKAVN